MLNLWALSRNGWANDYYSAAVRSMSSSWHNFLFASLDPSGVMTVDKPPLALWVQSLSVRVFGYHPLSILVPQALMGMATVALVYDLVRRRFGRFGGFVAGLALALTPITVAISRHNNPDALLVLCCVAALWCTVRALSKPPAAHALARARRASPSASASRRRWSSRWWSFPGSSLAWLWIAPRRRADACTRWRSCSRAARRWCSSAAPGRLLVELTPAADRPWVSGTSDNRILSLIFEYNGARPRRRAVGRSRGVGGGNMFGGTTGPLRLLNSALGGQAGWLLGFALSARSRSSLRAACAARTRAVAG